MKGKYGEPWEEFVSDSGSPVIVYKDTKMMVPCKKDVVFGRIIPCVNALEGLNPEAVRELVDAAKRVTAETCYKEQYGKHRYLLDDQLFEQLRAALEKLEEK